VTHHLPLETCLFTDKIHSSFPRPLILGFQPGDGSWGAGGGPRAGVHFTESRLPVTKRRFNSNNNGRPWDGPRPLQVRLLPNSCRLCRMPLAFFYGIDGGIISVVVFSTALLIHQKLLNPCNLHIEHFAFAFTFWFAHFHVRDKVCSELPCVAK
jgi:hypothetical protein